MRMSDCGAPMLRRNSRDAPVTFAVPEANNVENSAEERAMVQFGRRSMVVCAGVLWSLCLLDGAEQTKRLRPLPKLDENVKTGPAVGAPIPQFSAVDQNGRRQAFETLRGSKGLVLMFVRSADW